MVDGHVHDTAGWEVDWPGRAWLAVAAIVGAIELPVPPGRLRRIEGGLALMARRYRPRAPDEMMQRSFGAYFTARRPEVVRNLSR